MPKSFDFSANFDYSVNRVHSTITDASFWRDRFEDTPGSLELDDSGGPGTLTITMLETVGGDKLPGIVRKVVSGEMRLERVDSWDRLQDDARAGGQFRGSSSGIPALVTGTFVLRPTDLGCVLDVTGSVQVKIPLIGGQIEALVKKMVQDMVNRDCDALKSRMDQQG